MRYLLILLVLCACAPHETGTVEVNVCPCPNAYDGFATCAFFDADAPWAREDMLVDNEQSIGVGTPIRQDGYMHHKFCYNSTHAVFGSANPTENGLFRNDNIVVRVQSKAMAKGFAAEYAHLIGTGSGRHVQEWTLNDRRIKQHFCPRDKCEKHVLKELRAAKRSIVFLTFSFTSDPIGTLLVDKHREGVRVEGVVEPRNKNGLGSEYKRLTGAGILVAAPNTPGVMHHKAFVIDKRVAILGSYNPTANANKRNAETLVITEEPAVIAALLEEYARLAHNTFKP